MNDNEQRERLYDLIVDADNEFYRKTPTGTPSERIEKIADYLLANGVLVLPCKVGDVIFCHTYDHKEYAPIAVHSLSSLMQWVEDGNFGKWLFLTREEAETALKKRQEKE